tara:strand:- start:360 stop:1259 length:900 start_codon:yes stop_codon:yes gene_type:complete
MTPVITEGFNAIFAESVKICKDNDEDEKYLMTFQNFITRIPKWNNKIIEDEKKRILERSQCKYLEDLVSCVHVIQVKLLTAMRVGKKQKQIDISIPKIDDFIHKCYINCARDIYKNVYLFETNILPLEIQKYRRELEMIIQECVLKTVRDSIPVESILKAYMEETTEEDVTSEISQEPKISTDISSIVEKKNLAIEEVANNEIKSDDISHVNKISFNDKDYAMDQHNIESTIDAPKSLERLETLSNEKRMLEQTNTEEDDRIQIFPDEVKLDELDVNIINDPSIDVLPDLLMDDIEILS